MRKLLFAVFFALALGLAPIKTDATVGLLQLAGPACIAPTEAINAGYTKLVVCNSLSANNHTVDINNTLTPGYLLYSTLYGVTVPASNYSFGGTGMTLTPSASLFVAGVGGPVSTTITGTSFSGGTLSGGFFLEADMKFNPAYCGFTLPIPALWTNLAGAVANPTAAVAHYTEIDLGEWINCAMSQTIHDWTQPGSSNAIQNCTNSNNIVPFIPDGNFHTYGVLLATSTTHGGTGTVTWFIDHVQTISITYSPTGSPSSPSGTCGTGMYSTADTQQFVYMLFGANANPIGNPVLYNLSGGTGPYNSGTPTGGLLADAPIGSLVVLLTEANGGFNAMSGCADSVGNTYAAPPNQPTAATANINGESIYYAYTTHDMPIGTTFTCTSAYGGYFVSGIAVVNGASGTGSGVDVGQAVLAGSTGTGFSLASGSLAQANNIVFVGYNNSADPGINNIPAGWNSLLGGGDVFGGFAYQIVTDNTSVTYNPTWANSTYYTGVLASFKAPSTSGATTFRNLQVWQAP